MRRAGKPVARLLIGTEPERNLDVTALEKWGDAPVCLMDRAPVVSLGRLIWIDPATNLTYFANGGWPDSDSSAEFLCHSLEAARPGQGCTRIELPSFAIRPASLSASVTEGEESLVLDPGIVPHNLPPTITGYVRRGLLEETMRGYMLDSKRRHLINVRGPGGFGKTSLVLTLCHELASSPETSPYEGIVWMSARDIDLTLRGAAQVRRAEESLSDVWRRYARLFGEDEDGAARDFFEASMKEEAILLILDNFETFDEQEVAYEYLDDLVQPPAKIVITSRHVFKGDYALEVKGMSEDEAEQLLAQSARAAGIEPLMTPTVQQRIFERCQGHSYAMKLVASHVKSEAGPGPRLDAFVELRTDRLGTGLIGQFRQTLEDHLRRSEPVEVPRSRRPLDHGIAVASIADMDCIGRPHSVLVRTEPS